MKQIKFVFLTLILMVTANAQHAYGGLNAWYHAHTLATVGAGSVIPNSASDQLNPAAIFGESREFVLGVLGYPSGIRSGQIGFILPGNTTVSMFGIRTLSYGVFDGYDESGNSTGTYTASDTWFTGSYSQSIFQEQLRYGVTAGYYISKLSSYNSKLITITAGMMYYIQKLDLRLGLSIQNKGAVLNGYSREKEPLPEIVVVGVSKKLEHLPMTVFSDIGQLQSTDMIWVKIGGIIYASPHVTVKWGTSTEKLNQVTQVNLTNDYLGSSGIGLTFHADDIDLNVSSYMFGTGGWIHGFGCDVRF